MTPLQNRIGWAVAVMAAAMPASAADIQIRVGATQNSVSAPESIAITMADGTSKVGTAMIPPNVPAGQKAQLLQSALASAGVSAVASPVGDLAILNLPPGASLKVIDQGTADANSRATAPRAAGGQVSFSGQFTPINQGNQPAIFTAGIVTDVGTLSSQVSAAELNFQTDGPIICQALFQRLAPRAPQYGAQINYAGDRLEVYFDPAYTVTQGGIIFGTTSPSQGMSATLDLPLPTVPPVLPGDMNCDNVVNNFDIDGFVMALVFPSVYAATYPDCDRSHADIDRDGSVSNFDIDPFVALVVGH